MSASSESELTIFYNLPTKKTIAALPVAAIAPQENRLLNYEVPV